jgi:hypothetical protein
MSAIVLVVVWPIDIYKVSILKQVLIAIDKLQRVFCKTNISGKYKYILGLLEFIG